MSLVNKLTVKILLKDYDGAEQNTGSGILVVHHGAYYVLTAYHCINVVGDDNQVSPRPEDWNIELILEAGNGIKIKGIDENADDDIAAITVDMPEDWIDEHAVQLFTSTVTKEAYLFRGFPAFLNQQPHTFNVSFIDDDYWTFVNKGVDSGRKTGTDLLQGASGSGVVFVRRGKVFVVGIVRALHDSYGSLNEFKVIPIEKYRKFLPDDAFSTFSADMLDDWQKGLDYENTAKQIEELKQQKIDWIENILRKLKVLYPEQHAELLDVFLGYFVNGREFFVKEGNVNPTFWETLKVKTDSFFRTHLPSSKIYVDTAGEAKQEHQTIENKLVKALEDLIPEDSGDKEVGTSFAKYKLTERLLVCTLDYINRNQDGTAKVL